MAKRKQKEIITSKKGGKWEKDKPLATLLKEKGENKNLNDIEITIKQGNFQNYKTTEYI